MSSPVAKQPDRKAAIAVLLLSGSNAFRLAVQFLLFPVLAHLLGPADYGLMALAMPVVLFALVLGEGGMGPALVRSPDPTGQVTSTMFWTALGTGMLCASALVMGAPLVAAGLSHPEVEPVLRWLAPILVLSAVCSVPAARIQKSGETWKFALGDVASTVGGAAVAFGAALSGWGVWSLVSQQLVIWILKMAVMMGLTRTGIRARPSREAFSYLFRNGAPVVGANLMTLFSNTIDAVLIGRLIGVAPLGFYALAYQIVRIPESLVNGPVFISFMPAVARLDGDRPAVARLFLATVRMMFSVQAPLMFGLTLTASLAVPLVLGARWQPTAMVLMLLAPSAVAQTLGWVSMALLLGRGRSTVQFRLAFLNAALTVTGVLAGVRFGVDGVAAGVALAVVIGSLIAISTAMRDIDVSAGELLRTLRPTIVAVTIMACGLLAIRSLLPATVPAAATLALVVGAGVVLYGAAMQILAPETVAAALVLFRRRVAVQES